MAFGAEEFWQRCAPGVATGSANDAGVGEVCDGELHGGRSGAAFVLPQHPSGVMTLSSAHPVYCCPLREREPILRLAKSALVTVYPLPDTRLLMVVNIHAVNFSLGVDVYSKQLLPIGDQIAHHSGPVIMAGDFNAWSRRRMNALYRFAREMSLRQVRFTDDQRRRAFGRPRILSFIVV